MGTYQFELTTSNHELLRQGITSAPVGHYGSPIQLVTVSAPTIQEASLIAIQIGFCFGYVTSCNYIE